MHDIIINLSENGTDFVIDASQSIQEIYNAGDNIYTFLFTDNCVPEQILSHAGNIAKIGDDISFIVDGNLIIGAHYNQTLKRFETVDAIINTTKYTVLRLLVRIMVREVNQKQIIVA